MQRNSKLSQNIVIIIYERFMVKINFPRKFLHFRTFLQNKYLFFLGDLGKFRLKTLTSGTNMLILFDNF